MISDEERHTNERKDNLPIIIRHIARTAAPTHDSTKQLKQQQD